MDNIHIEQLASFIKSYSIKNKIEILDVLNLMGIHTVRTRDVILSMTREDGGTV